MSTYFLIGGVAESTAVYDSTSPRLAVALDKEDTDSNIYPDCLGIFEHGPNWNPPTFLRLQVRGNSFPDWLWLPNSCAVKDAVMQVLLDSGVTGFRAGNVEIANKSAREKLVELGLCYHFLDVVGRAKVAPESGVRLKYVCKLCGAKRYSHWRVPPGLKVDSPSDVPDNFFRLEEWNGMTFCDDVILELVQKHNWTGVSLQPMDQVRPMSEDYYSRLLPRWKYNIKV